jgi:hypothetical protein
MKPIHKAGLACAVLLPLAAIAQPVPPPTSPRAVELMKRPDIRNSIGGLKALTDLRLRGLRSLGFQEGAACTAPVPISTADIDIHRTLFVHDSATLNAGNFSLRRTLQKLSDDVIASVPATTPETIFRQFMDTQNDTASAATAGNPHCDDNNGKVNGYPLNNCPRPEGIEAGGTLADITSRIDNDYKPVALVNRIDLADKGWKNCGEHRIVYGKGPGAKNLVIFEAVLPNPKPGCRSGCRDVIDFWLDLSDDINPASRATKLENFFYTGLPGFQPVVKTTHYTSGTSSVYGGSSSGQIRTNQFLFKSGLGQGPWTLKEFKTFLSCSGGSCDYDILPSSVKVNPYGVLWNRDVATGTVPPLPAGNSFATAIAGLQTLAQNFQGDVLAQVTIDKLASPDINTFTYEVKLDKNAAESQSQSPVIDDYAAQFNGAADAAFRNDMNTAAAPFALSGAQVVNRAMTQSCAGCHLPNGFGLTAPNSIGPGMSWPSALTFVHVDTPPAISIASQPGFDPANFGGNTQGFNISPALLNAFLPARQNNLTTLANNDVCDCVPVPDRLTRDRLLIPRQKLIIDRFTKDIRTDIAAADKRFAARAAVKPGDDRRLLIEKKALIAKAETVRNRQLDEVGLSAGPLVMKVEPVKVSDQRLPAAQLRKAKVDKLNEIVNAEPPRETITGSFRSH